MVPSKRLIARLGITEFDGPAPLNEGVPLPASDVGISLKDHVGAPAKAVVKVGDRVSAGQMIGDVPDGALGARVHSSVEGTVISADESMIVIRR